MQRGGVTQTEVHATPSHYGQGCITEVILNDPSVFSCNNPQPISAPLTLMPEGHSPHVMQALLKGGGPTDEQDLLLPAIRGLSVLKHPIRSTLKLSHASPRREKRYHTLARRRLSSEDEKQEFRSTQALTKSSLTIASPHL